MEDNTHSHLTWFIIGVIVFSASILYFGDFGSGACDTIVSTVWYGFVLANELLFVLAPAVIYILYPFLFAVIVWRIVVARDAKKWLLLDSSSEFNSKENWRDVITSESSRGKKKSLTIMSKCKRLWIQTKRWVLAMSVMIMHEPPHNWCRWAHMNQAEHKERIWQYMNEPHPANVLVGRQISVSFTMANSSQADGDEDEEDEDGDGNGVLLRASQLPEAIKIMVCL